ncbi:cytochrome P450 [Aquamicrobium sp. LC103]|uniref:cytochrome P450 n=1 Tax=Aquamicrobium sp. LC103 TaxID=1120658 RepID=UPI000B04E08F|nr:cytochrome P450 [Aquamicrobium sp. LC103]TKT74723.1 cytochrome P450 [Aquamicrobium sp. LC103]
MITTKYYDGIREAQGHSRPASELPPFDVERLRSKGLGTKLKGLFLRDPRWWLTPVRRFRPMVKIGNVLLVTRNEDVREILERQDVFETPYGLEMTEIAGGTNFILGMRDGSAYRQMKSTILSAFPVDEVEKRVRPIAEHHSREIIMRAGPGFDAVHDLLKVVPVRICREYFGMVVEDEARFADWANALSGLFFADPFGGAVARELAVVAAEHMVNAIDLSMDVIREGDGDRDTPLGRLVEMLDRNAPGIKLGDVHSIMLGMIAGFTPTNLLASGNCLDFVLSRPEAQREIEAAIAAGENERLDRAILEAMRFRPIWIGPFRYANQDTVIAKGTDRERIVKAGTSIVPSTLSAMFDPGAVQRPNEFITDRPARDYMVFGHGIHQCIGGAIARIQIAECFRALFSKKNLRRAKGRQGRLASLGAYPDSLKVDFEVSPLSKTADHAMVIVVCEIDPKIGLADLREKVGALGNPAGKEITAALDASGKIHFASLAVAGRADPADEHDGEPAQLVLELSGDGTEAAVLEGFAAHAGPFVRGIFEEACGLGSEEPLESFMRERTVKISQLFGSTAGLVFSGTPGHSIARIRAEAELEAASRKIISETVRPAGINAGKTLAAVRARLAESGRFDWAFEPAESLLERPGHSAWNALTATLGAPKLLLTALVVFGLCWWTTYSLVFDNPTGFFRVLLIIGTALVLTVAGVLLFILVAGLVLFLWLRHLEKRDASDEVSVDPARLEEIIASENLSPQNNLTAISIMKPGLLRRITLWLAFLFISIWAKKVFRPGYLADINTIHFARWVKLPGTDKLMFFSNFGGSWESYLEDFINKAHAGLTSVWSNTLGFPKTRALFLDGATDGDRFKRWARRQQIPTLFWYSAYPGINTRRVRINSLIRCGLAKAETESEARNWLRLFGSLPPPAGALESDEIQTIFFGPLGPLEHARMIAVRIPEGLPRKARKEWLELVTAKTSFANRLPDREAMITLFGPEGLARLGLGGDVAEASLKTFSTAFRQGMGSPARSRALDDIGDSAPEKWEWGSREKPVDAMVVCYASTPAILEKDVAEFRERTTAAGMEVVTSLPLVIHRKGDKTYEHFGFADGISQPVVAGTPRSYGPVAPMHVVAPGEFLFGYKDELGFFPPTATVPASLDRGGVLPDLEDDAAPLFGGDAVLRDFARNGSYVVVRQLRQEVETFNKFCRQAVRGAREKSGNDSIDARWIAAKMVGRWQDGSSLVRNPNGRPKRTADNDFSFAKEDPQGLHCPLGSHVRRSNPRDTMGDDPDKQIRINKRHRILRVGRTYENGKEKGLLFMCLNADIERQYEFIQQSWVSATSFEGLQAEKDPTIGTQNENGSFSIPSPHGTVVLEKLRSFVTTRGGGYFFLPSRSAMHFLVARLSNETVSRPRNRQCPARPDDHLPECRRA